MVGSSYGGELHALYLSYKLWLPAVSTGTAGTNAGEWSYFIKDPATHGVSASSMMSLAELREGIAELAREEAEREVILTPVPEVSPTPEPTATPTSTPEPEPTATADPIVTPTPTVLLPPQNLTASVTHSSVTLRWDAPTGSAPIDGYRILRRAQGEHEFTHIADTSAEAAEYLDTTNISPSTKCIYRMRSLAADGSTSEEVRVEATTMSAP